MLKISQNYGNQVLWNIQKPVIEIEVTKFLYVCIIFQIFLFIGLSIFLQEYKVKNELQKVLQR